MPAVALAHDGHAPTITSATITRACATRSSSRTATTATHNGIPANEPTAGTVTSFANNVLTITLTNGNTVSGLVTNGTEVKCENPADATTTATTTSSTATSPATTAPAAATHGAGDDNGNRGDDNGNDNMCTITPGMAVRNAELRINGDGAFWDEVELISTSTSTTDAVVVPVGRVRLPRTPIAPHPRVGISPRPHTRDFARIGAGGCPTRTGEDRVAVRSAGPPPSLGASSRAGQADRKKAVSSAATSRGRSSTRKWEASTARPVTPGAHGRHTASTSP